MVTPTAWRKGGYKKYSKTILEESIKAKSSNASFDGLEATIVNMPSMETYYIRHNGYNDDIKQTWQKIQTWMYSNDIKEYKHIALFHDNPVVTHLDECQYIACIEVKDELEAQQRLPKFNISDGDFLKFMHWLYNEWLPNSEYETTTKPPYAVYKKISISQKIISLS